MAEVREKMAGREITVEKKITIETSKTSLFYPVGTSVLPDISIGGNMPLFVHFRGRLIN